MVIYVVHLHLVVGLDPKYGLLMAAYQPGQLTGWAGRPAPLLPASSVLFRPLSSFLPTSSASPPSSGASLTGCGLGRAEYSLGPVSSSPLWLKLWIASPAAGSTTSPRPS